MINRYNLDSTEQALLYITDCNLATVSYMASLRSRNHSEFLRQIEIAQIAVNCIVDFNISPVGTRTNDVITKTGGKVDYWAIDFMPKNKPTKKDMEWGKSVIENLRKRNLI